jgi:hypothetical protein
MIYSLHMYGPISGGPNDGRILNGEEAPSHMWRIETEEQFRAKIAELMTEQPNMGFALCVRDDMAHPGERVVLDEFRPETLPFPSRIGKRLVDGSDPSTTRAEYVIQYGNGTFYGKGSQRVTGGFPTPSKAKAQRFMSERMAQERIDGLRQVRDMSQALMTGIRIVKV